MNLAENSGSPALGAGAAGCATCSTVASGLATTVVRPVLFEDNVVFDDEAIRGCIGILVYMSGSSGQWNTEGIGSRIFKKICLGLWKLG